MDVKAKQNLAKVVFYNNLDEAVITSKKVVSLDTTRFSIVEREDEVERDIKLEKISSGFYKMEPERLDKEIISINTHEKSDFMVKDVTVTVPYQISIVYEYDDCAYVRCLKSKFDDAIAQEIYIEWLDSGDIYTFIFNYVINEMHFVSRSKLSDNINFHGLIRSNNINDPELFNPCHLFEPFKPISINDIPIETDPVFPCFVINNQTNSESASMVTKRRLLIPYTRFERRNYRNLYLIDSLNYSNGLIREYYYKDKEKREE